MVDSGGVGGFHMPPSGEAKGVGSAGSDQPEFQGLEQKGDKKIDLTKDQMDQIHQMRLAGGFGGKISPLEMWFMQHTGGDPVEGEKVYQHFMNSMMMTAITGMSTSSRQALQRQKQHDREAYGGMG